MSKAVAHVAAKSKHTAHNVAVTKAKAAAKKVPVVVIDAPTEAQVKKALKNKTAIQAALAAKMAPAPDLTSLPACVCRRIGQSYSCIRVKTDDAHAYYIPMASLAVEKAHLRDFRADWEEFPEYPVRRAAECYLEAGKYQELDPKVRDHLKAIVKDPLTVYNLTPTTPKETEIMATAKKTAPAKTPVAKKADTKAPGVKAPAGTGTISKTAKAAPNKNGIATVVSGAKPPAKTATATAKAPPVRAANNEKLKVADASAARRGETAAYVEEAVKLKTFTRQQIADKMVSLGREPDKARIKVADCVYWEIFVRA